MLLFLMVTVVIREVFQKMVIFLQSDAFLLQTWSVHAHQHYIKIIIVTVIAKNDSQYVSTDHQDVDLHNLYQLIVNKVWIFTGSLTITLASVSAIGAALALAYFTCEHCLSYNCGEINFECFLRS